MKPKTFMFSVFALYLGVSLCRSVADVGNSVGPAGEPAPTQRPAVVQPTKAQPTSRPQPTRIPATPTAELQDLQRAVDYTDDVMDVLLVWSGSGTAIADLFDQASLNTYLLTDPAWKAKLRIEFDAILAAGLKLRGLNPPPELEDAHAELMLAAFYQAQSIEHQLLGIDQMDIDELTEGIELMIVANNHLEAATALIEGR